MVDSSMCGFCKSYGKLPDFVCSGVFLAQSFHITTEEGVGGQVEQAVSNPPNPHDKAAGLDQCVTCSCWVHAMHQGHIQTQCLPQLCFCSEFVPIYAHNHSLFSRIFFLYLLSLWATVCSISFALYCRHGIVLHKPTRDPTPRGAHSRRMDFESARSRTVWRPNVSYSRHLRICMSQGRAPLLSAFCH
jgi:hypothetical protein